MVPCRRLAGAKLRNAKLQNQKIAFGMTGEIGVLAQNAQVRLSGPVRSVP